MPPTGTIVAETPFRAIVAIISPPTRAARTTVVRRSFLGNVSPPAAKRFYQQPFPSTRLTIPCRSRPWGPQPACACAHERPHGVRNLVGPLGSAPAHFL